MLTHRRRAAACAQSRRYSNSAAWPVTDSNTNVHALNNSVYVWGQQIFCCYGNWCRQFASVAMYVCAHQRDRVCVIYYGDRYTWRVCSKISVIRCWFVADNEWMLSRFSWSSETARGDQKIDIKKRANICRSSSTPVDEALSHSDDGLTLTSNDLNAPPPPPRVLPFSLGV